MSNEREQRAFAVEGLRIEKREGKGPMLRGHAAVFNQLSDDLGGFREQIKPGAFAEAIRGDDVRALFNHDANFILGRNVSKTLRLAEDERGLSIEIDMPDSQTIRDLVAGPVERGDVTQMSFAFSVRPGGQDWTRDDKAGYVRTLMNVRLYDVSPVVFPAYPQTDVAVRELRAFEARKAPVLFTNMARARQQLAELR